MFQKDYFSSFGGLSDQNLELSQADVIIQGIPYEGATSGKKGASFAPSNIRMLSKDMQTVSRRGKDFGFLKILDMGDVILNPLNDEEVRLTISDSFSYLLQTSVNRPIITLGGDHSITYPLVKTLAQMKKIGVIWLDAHRDLLDYFLNSKFSHGSPLRRIIELESINSNNVLLVGTRYMTAEENYIVKNENIMELRMVDLEESKNYLDLFEKAVFKTMEDVESIYISIDIDVLDPAYAPGTGTPVGGGMTTSMLMNLIDKIPLEEKIRAIDIVEVSPPLDPSGITSKGVLGLLTELIAKVSHVSN